MNHETPWPGREHSPAQLGIPLHLRERCYDFLNLFSKMGLTIPKAERTPPADCTQLVEAPIGRNRPDRN